MTDLLSARRLMERGAHELQQAGVSGSRFEAELLLRHALGCSREILLARLDESVPPEAAGHFFQIVERRRGRVPTQYLVGAQEFWGLEFRVTPDVLIPRPETEGLVEETLRRLARSHAVQLADVGCGSGCIAASLAFELPEARVFATDISPAALAVARENALRLGVGERIQFLPGDLLEPLMRLTGKTGKPAVHLDAVVSNPPYLREEEMDSLSPEVRDHEPRIALAGGRDGLAVVRRLIPEAETLLAAGGLLLMEIGAGMESAVKRLLAGTTLSWEATARDLQGLPRVIVARKR